MQSAAELPKRATILSVSRQLGRLIFAITSALALGAASARALPTVYTIGDSTVQTWNSGYYPKAGWGQVLPKFFDSTRVNVVNKAVGGTSSKSFYNNYWSAVRNSLVSGDYVFIQFGINDRANDPERQTDAATTFKDYLRSYVNETRGRGANPVIVATLRRNAWNSDGVTVYDAYHGHPVAAREVAVEMNVPCVDLDGKSKVLMESLGKPTAPISSICILPRVSGRTIPTARLTTSIFRRRAPSRWPNSSPIPSVRAATPA